MLGGVFLQIGFGELWKEGVEGGQYVYHHLILYDHYRLEVRECA